MGFTLQYESYDGQFRTLDRDSVTDAITAAIEMARSKDGRTPLRVLTPNGGVAVSKEALKAQIEHALNPRPTGVPSAVTLKVRSADTNAVSSVHCRSIKEAIKNGIDLQNEGKFLPNHIIDTDTQEVIMTESRLLEAIRVQRVRNALNRVETERMEKSSLWGAF